MTSPDVNWSLRSKLGENRQGELRQFELDRVEVESREVQWISGRSIDGNGDNQVANKPLASKSRVETKYNVSDSFFLHVTAFASYDRLIVSG